MPAWTYTQHTGEMTDPEGTLVETGYSGSQPYTNKARAEWREDQGPIPSGDYTIGAAYDHATCGPCSMPLEPHSGNEMHGRSAFLIHGDNEDHTASTGCIILSRPTRDLIDASAIRWLVVVP